MAHVGRPNPRSPGANAIQAKSRLLLRCAAAIGCLCLSLAQPEAARAEIPIIEPIDYGPLLSQAQFVPDPRHMSFVMGTLNRAGDVDVVAFDYAEGEPFNAQVYIPAHDDLAEFSPDIALIGPGLPAPAEALPVELPQGYGAIVARSNKTYVYFDIFTQIPFYPRANISLHMPKTGRYYIAVYGKPAGRSIYALDIGVEETYAPSAIARYPINWLEVHQSMNMPIWPTPVTCAAASLVIGAVWRARVTRRRAFARLRAFKS